jgi:hypothetical protein
MLNLKSIIMKAKKTAKKVVNLAAACNVSRTAFVLNTGKGAPSSFAGSRHTGLDLIKR